MRVVLIPVRGGWGFGVHWWALCVVEVEMAERDVGCSYQAIFEQGLSTERV